jgi:hypothetical protein
MGQDAPRGGPIHNPWQYVDCRPRHPNENRMKFLLHASVVAVVFGSVACRPNYVVVPATGGNMAKADRGGLSLNAVPNAWDDDPSDLSSYMTPIWVQLVNHGKQDVRVVYADFALTNSSGFRYAAISPYPYQGKAPENPQPAAAPTSTNDRADTSDRVADWYFDKADVSLGQMRLAPPGDGTGAVELVRGGRMGGGGGRMGGGGHFGGGRMGGGGHVGGFGHVGPRYGGGFHGHPYYRGYYGGYGYWGGYYGYYSPWPFFYAWPPYYGPYVYYWGPRYYPAEPSEAVMQRGLPEGVLRAGGTVSGYVYFQHASTAPTNLDLSWAPEGVDGKRMVALHVMLTVVED